MTEVVSEEYPLYPTVDYDFKFPPVIREAMVNSPEFQEALDGQGAPVLIEGKEYTDQKDAENRTAWATADGNILDAAKLYANDKALSFGDQVAQSAASALSAANLYTDGKDTDNRTAWATADAEDLAEAKQYTDDKDTANRTAWTEAAAIKPPMGAVANFDDFIKSAIIPVPSSTTKTNIPVALPGTLYVEPANTSQVVQHYHTWESTPRTYNRRLSAGVWGTWRVGTWSGGLIAIGVDFDTIATLGVYSIQSASHPNQAVPVIGTLEVLPASASYMQRFTTLEGRPHQYIRRYSGTAWGAWAAQTWEQGLIAIGADIDNVTVLGAYGVQSTANPNLPVAVIGTLEVLPASALYTQRYTTNETNIRVFHRRYSTASGTPAWGPWTEPGGAASGGVVTDTSAYGVVNRKPITSTPMVETSKLSYEIMVAMSPDRTKGWNANGTALKETRDEGETWSTVHTFPAGTAVETVLPLANGELLVFIYNGTTSMRWGYLSTGYGKPGTTWDIVITGRKQSIKFTQSWSVFTHENIVLVNEYGPKEGFPWGNIENVANGDSAMLTFMSLDHGKTWSTIFNLNDWLISKGRTTVGQHPHGIAWDKYWDRIWYTFGDNNGGSGCNGILYSDDLGETWKEADFFSGPNGTQVVGIMPMPKCVLFAGDTNPSGLYRINRAEGKQRTGHYTKDLAYDAPSESGTHLCHGIVRINRVGDDAPAFFGFSSELNTAQSFIIGTYDGYVVTEVWRDTAFQPVGMGMRSVVGPTLRGNIVAVSNDLKVTGKWSQLKGKSPGY